MIKVCHMTSAHKSTDIRIFHKECASLAQAGYNVCHVAFGDSREEKGVHVVGLGVRPSNRMKRMAFAARQIYKAALKLDCDIYHFHDPELLPYGAKLKKHGKKVIFDSHEDVPAQILGKGWIPALLRRWVAGCYKVYETHAVRRLDAVVAATPHIAEQFKGRAKRVATVNNYPMLDDIVFHDTPFAQREPIACYAGGIGTMRGEQVMLKAMEGVEGKLMLAGDHPETEGKGREGDNVIYLGQIGRERINQLYGESVAGLVLFLPSKNHREAQPNKMYEYMAAGLPFIASDFPAWREVADKWKCGLCVPPDDPVQVREAIKRLFEDRALAQRLGRNGRAAVEREYNWDSEEKRLISLYQAIGRKQEKDHSLCTKYPDRIEQAR